MKVYYTIDCYYKCCLLDFSFIQFTMSISPCQCSIVECAIFFFLIGSLAKSLMANHKIYNDNIYKIKNQNNVGIH